MVKLENLIDVNEIDLPQLMYWYKKLRTEINKRIKDTMCPHCHSTIGQIEVVYCPHCGGHIKWLWEI